MGGTLLRASGGPMCRSLCTRFSIALSCCATVCALSSCGSDPPSNGTPTDTPDADPGCSRPGDDYHVGLSKTSTSGNITVELSDANPAPPGYGTNHWSLKISDANHAAVAGAMVNLTLRMPDHADHTMPGTAGVQTSDGNYDVSNLNLTMPGLYNITVEVRMGGASESVVFQFCVARKGE